MSTENLQLSAEDTKKISDELKEHFENSYYGIDTDKLIAFVDYKQTTWKIKPDAHTKSNRSKLIEISDTFAKEMKQLDKNPNATRAERETIAEKATKGVLEHALVGFDYEKWAEDAKAGPNILGLLANEVNHFLVENGGREGSKHLQMLAKLEALTLSNSSKALKKNGKSTSTTD